MRTEKKAEMYYWKELTMQPEERFNNERCGQREREESHVVRSITLTRDMNESQEITKKGLHLKVLIKCNK